MPDDMQVAQVTVKRRVSLVWHGLRFEHAAAGGSHVDWGGVRRLDQVGDRA
ncbi:MAG: hypothetical protein M0Z82_07975 [Actinomycetota bacterium]|nr:hypothetical protein [Actinomycetota bacterium]